MKYNLKNRPKEAEQIRYDWWFEGFEKELRSFTPDKLVRSGITTPRQLIKEILGE